MTDETSQPSRAPKGRSPSYPGVPLQTAVERARTVYEQARKHPVPIGTITKWWGYKSSTTGPASVTYAALKKFGLLDDEGTGTSRQARLTDLAVEILMKPNPLPAVQQAALRPAIHREMWEAYGTDLPPDDTLRWELVGQRGFTESGFEDFIRGYRDTITYAQLDSSASVGSDTSPADEDDDTDQDERGEQGEANLQTPRQRRRPAMKDENGVLTIPVPVIGGPPIIVEGEFPITEAAWDQFLAVLAAMKPGLVTQRSGEPTSSTNE